MSTLVILSEKKEEKKKKEQNELPTEEELSFQAIQEKNKANEERLKKERAKANKSVLRSYRIKN